jgi:hypothetical protein
MLKTRGASLGESTPPESLSLYVEESLLEHPINKIAVIKSRFFIDLYLTPKCKKFSPKNKILFFGIIGNPNLQPFELIKKY